MSQLDEDLPAWVRAIPGHLARHWKWTVVAVWLAYCGMYIFNRWAAIDGFALADTDDNLRISQVRALLGGQDWYDLRQYRLNPPDGANVHWSRLVDLPLAGLILLLRPFIGGAEAERWAVAIAPLLPLLIALVGLSLTVRRLIDPRAFPLALVSVFFAGSTMGMFVPLRIDHHGWQLAILSISVAGLADPKRRRGGATVGVATALSLAIGLELLIYLAIAGAAIVLFWIVDPKERPRLAAYAVTVAGATGLAFLLFASEANRLAVCDALSPVWLSNALLGGALLFGIVLLDPPDWKRRLALAAVGGIVVAAFHALAWPHCLSRLEGVSPEVERLWLSRVSEARPIYTHGWRTMVTVMSLPVIGLIGWGLLIWRTRSDRPLQRRAIAAAVPGLIALLLLMWQTRTGPAAQLLSVPGAVALVWILAPIVGASRFAAVRLVGFSAVVIVGLGAVVPLIMSQVPGKKQSKSSQAVAKANRLCGTLAAWRGVARQPKGMVFTFVDYGPRLITVTHHNAVTGPYHRNGEQIADVMKAFRGSDEQARRIIAKYRSDYLLICPNSSTPTIFMSEAPKGFYGRLSKGQVPGWLEPVELPANSPFKMWRVAKGGGSAGEAG